MRRNVHSKPGPATSTDSAPFTDLSVEGSKVDLQPAASKQPSKHSLFHHKGHKGSAYKLSPSEPSSSEDGTESYIQLM